MSKSKRNQQSNKDNAKNQLGNDETVVSENQDNTKMKL